MNWDELIYQSLIANPPVLTAAQIRIRGGMLGVPKDRPFMILDFGDEPRHDIPGVEQRDLSVWVHDDPGDYQRIGRVLADVRARLESVVAAGVVSIVWQGNSQGLPDDGLNTITRNGSFRMLSVDRARA